MKREVETGVMEKNILDEIYSGDDEESESLNDVVEEVCVTVNESMEEIEIEQDISQARGCRSRSRVNDTDTNGGGGGRRHSPELETVAAPAAAAAGGESNDSFHGFQNDLPVTVTETEEAASVYDYEYENMEEQEAQVYKTAVTNFFIPTSVFFCPFPRLQVPFITVYLCCKLA